MKSRKYASLKVDKEIHDRIIWLKDRNFINVSIQEFVNNTLSDRIQVLGHKWFEGMTSEKLDQLFEEMKKQKKMLEALEKTHTPSRKTKRKK